MNRSILIAAALSVTALVAGAANAQTRENAQISVSTKNVDFNNARDTRTFYAKLEAAARNVCTSEISDPMTTMADAKCEQAAVSEAAAQINAPQLSALVSKTDPALSVAMTDQN